ncbi:hypothetical protein Patl1_26698 [Pistacia atlantica]|uniref:Uncharacterized protein n=1 Tax=Pistacia atlantica TaxID=434234 RepID=A0ACC1AZ93_9ROSI|nr:hypothetical protein Patl1_26698 [Pistacia atlantica]
MSCIQATSVGKPCVTLPNRSQLQRVPGTTHGTLLKLTYKQCAPRLKYRQGSTVVCLFGDKDKSEDTKSPWDAFGKAMENLGNFTKGKSVEGMLRQQIEKKEYFDGSGGKSPPRFGGGGGGDGSGDSEDEGWGGIIDETAQVILATLGIIFVYMYILTGEELTLLARDYLKYLFGRGYKSVRLTNAMEWWESFRKISSRRNLTMISIGWKKQLLIPQHGMTVQRTTGVCLRLTWNHKKKRKTMTIMIMITITMMDYNPIFCGNHLSLPPFPYFSSCSSCKPFATFKLKL